MPSLSDLLEAKTVLGGRYLRRGIRDGVVSLAFATRVNAAVASAGSNVHAVGIGRKISDGRITAELCVRLYVVQKLADSLLPPRDRLPAEVNGIPTDVVESPPGFIQSPPRRRSRATSRARRVTAAAVQCTTDRRNRQRPVVAGISTAHHNVTAGTIGYFCRSTRPGDEPSQVYVLSNNHVYADVNLGSAGDDLYQPGPADGGTATDHFAELTRFVKIQLGLGGLNRVDAAIGALLPGVAHSAEICSIGAVNGTQAAEEEMEVAKHGRTTGYTEGIVDDISYDAVVGMDHNNPAIFAEFQSQIRIRKADAFATFGLGGDSGSLVVTKTGKKAVGLYFAGPDDGSYGVANRIEDVLAELEIQLL